MSSHMVDYHIGYYHEASIPTSLDHADELVKFIYLKYSKIPTVAHTLDCVCSKLLNHNGLLFSIFKFFG